MKAIETVHPLRNLNGCINTVSGKKFNLLEPKPEMVEIIDIAKGLSFKPHFGGMTPHFFSIAMHSILVKDLMLSDGILSERLLLAALLHDASEAYTGDMIKPLKVHLPVFCEIEDRIQSVIFEKFNLDLALMKKVKHYDMKAQEIEFDEFYKGGCNGLKYMNPFETYLMFKQEIQKYL